jgi:NADPH:quinone reductase-like Zn-dependent oxidoreductase
MRDKLMNLSSEQKDLLVKKLGLYFNKHSDEKPAEIDYRKPFGYQIPISNFSKIVCKNYEIPSPGPQQVQIQAKAISLNFRDLMIALGLYAEVEGIPLTMGGDYSGVVVACGEGVEDFKVGDEVISLHGGDPAIKEHFVNRINAYTCQTTLKPKNLSFQEACCIPTVFLTAYHGLCHIGNLSKNQAVLIHTATGGVGLAAIQIAKWREAIIFATAGSDEKRNYLRSIGIETVMNSRTLDFYEQILEKTKGVGVDLILNTLSGEALEKGMRLLKTFGRFVQIDKNDIYQERPINLSLFKKSTSFTFLDLSLFYSDNRIKIIFDDVCSLFRKGIFSPLPLQLFSHSSLADALNYMAKGKYIGKIVLDFGEKP